MQNLLFDETLSRSAMGQPVTCEEPFNSVSVMSRQSRPRQTGESS
jgi:hypothetical protein